MSVYARKTLEILGKENHIAIGPEITIAAIIKTVSIFFVILLANRVMSHLFFQIYSLEPI